MHTCIYIYLSWDKVFPGDSILLSIEHSILLSYITVWLQLYLCSWCMDGRQCVIHCIERERRGLRRYWVKRKPLIHVNLVMHKKGNQDDCLFMIQLNMLHKKYKCGSLQFNYMHTQLNTQLVTDPYGNHIGDSGSSYQRNLPHCQTSTLPSYEYTDSDIPLM